MDSSIQKIGKVFPKGFYKKTDKDGNVFLDEKGNPVYLKRRLDAGELAERLDIYLQQRLRYNLLKLCVELDHQPIDPELLKNFYVFLSTLGWATHSKVAIDGLLWTAHKNNFHPIVEFLENLEKDKNIIPVNINNIATDYLGVDDELSNNMMKITLVGMIARVMNRGCQLSISYVLTSITRVFQVISRLLK